MRAIILDKFGGLDSLTCKTSPSRSPRPAT